MHRRPGLRKSSDSASYSAAMPRIAPAHTSEQQNFSSQESFAGLLDRLTQRVHAGSGMQELPDADIPAARTPAFSSAAIRKQSMIPVAKLKPKTDRLADEASELSYENPLRLRRRSKPVHRITRSSPAGSGFSAASCSDFPPCASTSLAPSQPSRSHTAND